MPVPSVRYKILPARGAYSALAAGIADIANGEICYATDQDQYYQNESGTLVSVGATKAQGALADTATQPGDNLSTLTNDLGLIADITGESVGDLSDVVLTSPTNGDFLKYNGTNWVNDPSGGGGASALNDLTDVTITAAATGEVLRYNGSAWVDAQLAYSDLSGTPTNVSSFTNDAGYISDITGESIGDLSDVTITAAATGEVLRYNGSAWVDAQLDYSDLSGTPTLVTDLNGLSDVTITAAATGEVLRYNGSAWVDAQLNSSDLNNDSGFIANITAEPIGDLSDVVLTSPTNGQVLQYNGTNWVNATGGGGGATQLNELTDVTITAAATGEVLRYNGSAWVDAQLDYSDLSGTPTLVTDLNGLSDVTITTAATGEVLRYNGSAWVDAQLNSSDLNNDSGFITGITAEPIGDLSDVVLTSPTNGQYLQYNGTNWVNVNASGGGGATQLNELSDVTITAAATGEVLRYNGTAWVDAQLNTSDLNNDSNFLASSDIGVTVQGYDVDTVKQDVAPTFTATVQTTERTITGGAFDLSTGNHWTCGAITVPAPTNAVAGTSGLIRITAGPVVWNAVFKFPGGTAPTIGTFPAIIPFYVESSSVILMGNVVEGIS